MNLKSHNWIHIIKEGVIVGIGAGLTYLTEYVITGDFGQMTPVVVAGWSVLVNYVRKLYVDKTE